MGSKKFGLEAIFSATDNISAPLAKIKTKLGAFGKGAAGALKGANSAVDKGLAGIGRFSNVLGIGAAASLAGVAFELKNVMTNGAAFEKTLIRAGSAFEVPVKKGTAGFKELSNAARAVGRTTEFSAQSASEGLNSLATAGFNAKQSMAALPKIIDFASAGNLELSQSSDIASDSLGAFNLRSANAAENTRNMGRVMDSLTRAAADSTTNVAELFEGIKMGGAFAATSGASIEQFVGMLGVLANKGIKGGEAGTAIRNSFLHLTKPTKEASATMAHLGIKIAKTKDGAIDMAATIGRFSKATSKLTKAQKAQAIATVFGAYTVGPFLSLMNAGEGSIRDFTKNLEGATGVTEKMAKAMRESKSAEIAMFFNKIEDVRLGVFEAISGTVLEIAGSVGDWVTANQALINTKAAEWAVELRDSLPGLWKWTKRVTVAVAAFLVVAAAVKAITLLVTIVGGLSAAYTYLFVSTTAAAGGTGALSFALNFAWLATLRSSVATAALTVAQIASRAATILSAAAHWAYATPLNATLLATIGSRIATVALTVAQYASRAAMLVATAVQWLYTAAQTAYTGSTLATCGALVSFRVAALASVPAIGAQVTALTPLLVTIAAVTAAVTALVAVWNQYNALDKTLAGSGGISGTVGRMIEMGTFDPFEAHDAAMNEKAVADRDRRDRETPQMVTPGARAASEANESVEPNSSSVDGTITVEAKPGTKAQVKPGRGPLKIKAHHSGAFPA